MKNLCRHGSSKDDFFFIYPYTIIYRNVRGLAVTGALDAITNLFNDVKNSQFPATQAVSPPASIVFTA
jgi:hypothetical protein